MKTKLYNFIAAGLVLLAGACTDDWQHVDNQEGSLDLSSMGISASDENEAQQAGASSRADVDYDNFIITIFDNHGLSQDDWQWTFATMPEVIRLPVGNGYKVVVESHEIKPAAWSEPYFIGSETFDIKEDEITRLGTILCYFHSLKVTVIFEDEFKKRMSADSKVSIFRHSTPDKLDFKRDETRSGYFEHNDGPATVVAIFDGMVDGNAMTDQNVYTVEKPGMHLVIKYGVQPNPQVPSPTGTANTAGVQLDVQFEVVSSSSMVEIDEDKLPGTDRPGQEQQPEQPDEPKPAEAATFTPDGVVLNQDNKLSDVTKAIVNITCPEGFQKLEVTIDSETLSAADLRDIGLDGTFDLCNPGSMKTTLDNLLKINSGEAIKGQTYMEFNVSELVGLLGVLGKGRSTFIIKVTDAKDETSETKLIIVV